MNASFRYDRSCFNLQTLARLTFDAKKYEASEFLTLEKFVTNMAEFILCELKTEWKVATVSAEKPNIFAFAKGPGVEITRSIDDFAKK